MKAQEPKLSVFAVWWISRHSLHFLDLSLREKNSQTVPIKNKKTGTREHIYFVFSFRFVDS